MKREVLVISAVWCPSCLILKKHLKKLKEEYNLDVNYLDYDFDEDEVKKYDVKDILPVMIILEGDSEVSRLIGEKTSEEIISFLKEMFHARVWL